MAAGRQITVIAQSTTKPMGEPMIVLKAEDEGIRRDMMRRIGASGVEVYFATAEQYLPQGHMQRLAARPTTVKFRMSIDDLVNLIGIPKVRGHDDDDEPPESVLRLYDELSDEIDNLNIAVTSQGVFKIVLWVRGRDRELLTYNRRTGLWHVRRRPGEIHSEVEDMTDDEAIAFIKDHYGPERGSLFDGLEGRPW